MYVRSWLEDLTMDKYFDIDEMMIEYSEMTGFDFNSKAFQEIRTEVSEYAKQAYTFKYGYYDCLDLVAGLTQGA